ncbi:hypothetical protein AA23498_0721 [Acetobacter nitrogenifigens DSM 23921 = NBRC 105050]|uniref:Secreted protein n=1 Tax=Acetobacter nitrogenifigens DSM 23921 = NBRC 105050 TaxID=1120919 RepID=A0A511X8G7_9PROT|nr:hypothetical protein [Acetobacter nitrogenifigens]GBQ89822.1 hypothetical protein AA23498_0721 [Acetobacter nitrogenifigens DSM 23921 = NBRC 105050]GEN59247.1 hypothetical protein ANI02nite_11310 [Acetobacter nitrogenifigens DSM 23921 = NBRC 105050]
MAQPGSRHIRNSVACLLLLAGGVNASAAPPKCKAKTYQAAEDASFKVASWSDYLAWYRAYRGCEEGEVGEQFADVTEKLLGDQWSGFAAMKSQLTADKAFLPFIVRNVSSVSGGSLMTKIIDQAHEQCPHGLEAACAAIGKKAKYVADGGT